ncbi:guanitoxin biosynthesis heme-dependent pre-guanitoxin N-hydroxylase GntA [Novosphingopyxis sp.]|uniref:guanitoxin biosynthesis heme-dependent pre-guanitoxin N-hydroxylase GntA n=1 Tax=Novosphingopyxis sp. TaxID=2709690 RepID=UPI003B5B7B0F
MHPTPPDLLERFIARNRFPCVGAKSALGKRQLEIVTARSIASSWNDVEIHRQLLAFAETARADPRLFRSFAVIFCAPRSLSEQAFERHMWARIQSLTDKDVWLGQKPDADVSADPDNPHFSLSFGGSAFFVVGLHPGASRKARRFRYPTLVFNLHDQFETLREQGRYEKLRGAILARDHRLQGSDNPMLSRHGTVSEARQYSGRAVPGSWSAPYQRAASTKDIA